MAKATHVVDAGHRHGRAIVDTVILDYEQRAAGKASATGINGTSVDIELEQPTRLRTDDLIVLDDGNLVEVVAAAEPLIEARAADLAGLMRLAWHLGDRHLPVEVLTNRIRVKQDPAIETLLRSLGARLVMIEAPFEPEGGAYTSHAHGHDHTHGHHGHDH
jgi:urease accessory protein